MGSISSGTSRVHDFLASGFTGQSMSMLFVSSGTIPELIVELFESRLMELMKFAFLSIDF